MFHNVQFVRFWEYAWKYVMKNTSSALENAIALSTDGKVRYTVPQRITSSKKVTVYFRVADVYRDVRIVVRDGDKVVINKKKQKVAPGEMETVTLTPAMIEAVTSGKLAFSIKFDS